MAPASSGGMSIDKDLGVLQITSRDNAGSQKQDNFTTSKLQTANEFCEPECLETNHGNNTTT